MDFLFGLQEDAQGNTGIVIFVDRFDQDGSFSGGAGFYRWRGYSYAFYQSSVLTTRVAVGKYL